MAKKDKKASKSEQNIVLRIIWKLIHGQIMTVGFLKAHWWKIGLAVFMIVAYISMKYECQTSMVTIDKLKNELEVVKNQCITERSKYMGSTRESAMQELVDTLKLNLKKQDQPPFKISYSE
ncbi:MAG: hypothetical protein IKV32_07055 [Muribaculaceae bacterium]|nr:hypothetical protein [Muribaculaceae bacterium]